MDAAKNKYFNGIMFSSSARVLLELTATFNNNAQSEENTNIMVEYFKALLSKACAFRKKNSPRYVRGEWRKWFLKGALTEMGEPFDLKLCYRP